MEKIRFLNYHQIVGILIIKIFDSVVLELDLLVCQSILNTLQNTNTFIQMHNEV
jgi:hypothetical protein